MKYFFNNDVKAWPVSTRPFKATPTTEEEKNRLVDELQDAKTEFYVNIVEQEARARPGVLELMDEAIADPSIKVTLEIVQTWALFSNNNKN